MIAYVVCMLRHICDFSEMSLAAGDLRGIWIPDMRG